jgi:hypothetical protein
VLLALLLAGSALGLLNAQSAPIPNIDASGVWLATGVPYAPWTIRLKQNGTTLTGTMEQNGGLTGTVAIYEGAISGSAISFKANSPDGARAITFTGTFDGDAITLHRSTKVITNGSQGGAGLYGTQAAPEFLIRRQSAAATAGRSALFIHKGIQIDISSLPSGPDRDSILSGFRRQIDMVDAAITDPSHQAFVRSVPFLLAAQPQTPADEGHYSARDRRIELLSLIYHPEKPIFLHELMHAYHDQKLRDGYANADIRNLFQQAKTSGQFPSNAYMLSNPVEYFAMVASVYLYGSAARDPFTPQALQQKQPDCYRWLEKEFGPRQN